MTQNIVEPSLEEALAQPGLELDEVTNETGVAIGEAVVGAIKASGASLAVRVVVNGDIVFQAKLGSTGPGNDQWLSGKAQHAEASGEASILARLRAAEAGTPLDLEQYYTGDGPKPFGGSVPIVVDGSVVGTVTASGEADYVDHAVVVDGIRRFLARG